MATTRHLTAVEIERLKPTGKEYKKYDGLGLFLLVTPAGKKLWRFKYMFEGKEKCLSFGSYPEFTLQEARERRDEARYLRMTCRKAHVNKLH